MLDLHSFLHAHKTDNKKTISHVSLIYPKGKFLINDDDIKTFWDLYNEFDKPKGIGEVSLSPLLPILVDIDLKKEINLNHQFLEDRVLYSLDNVKTIVNIYQKILSEIIYNIDEKHLVCFLLEKKAYPTKSKDKTYLKNGFHLHFPYIFLNKSVHENELIPRIRLEMKKLKSNELPAVTNAYNCIDSAYTKNAWLLYGSQKENNQPYFITCALDEKCRVVEDWHNLFEDYHIYDANKNKIPIDVINIDKFLPQILSIINNHRLEYIYELKKDLPKINPTPKTNLAIKSKKNEYPENMDNISKLVDQLLRCINDERAEDRNEWMQIGWILFNIFNGLQEGYDRWLEFSKRSDKCEESVCFYEWNRMTKKDLTIGSLKYIAKEDNPELYNSILLEYNKPLFDKCLRLDGTHNDLANVLYEKYECEFVCASVSQRIWYQFVDHIWEKTEEGNNLRMKISNELVNEYEKILHTIVQQTQDDDTRKKRSNSAMKLIKNLKSAPFKNHVMKEASEIFYKPNFAKKLNTNPYLIAFSNGVYDIKNHIFRDGIPTDLISLKMNIGYYDKYTDDCPEIKEIELFFEKIFPDIELREYFLDSVADIFIGGNFNKIVQIWTGEGDNGKSITQMIFEQMLGPYNVKLPTSLIVGKRTQSSAACPELVRAGNGVRLAMLQEPDKKDLINIGIMKELSGNDTFFARGLYKEGQEITPMFKLILICNEPPKLPHSDKATWNRIKLIPFESTFTNDAPEDYEEQLFQKKFPKDEKFKDKIPRMLEPLAWYLLKRLKTKPKMKKEPLKVTLATNNYKKKNDVFKQFMDEWIEEKEGKSCSAFEMYSSFREWQKESCPNHSCPDKNEFNDYFIRLWGPMDPKGNWKNKFLRGPIDNS